MPQPTIKRAQISACGAFRYRLERRWGEGRPLVFVMLNPSTADSTVDDPTIRRCISFALAHGFEAMEVVNLYAFRSSNPSVLWRVPDPIGRYNDAAIEQAARDAAALCVAWGAQPRAHDRVQEVLPMLRRNFAGPVQCLQITRSGHPSHPLMLRKACRLQPFTLAAIDEAIHAR